MPTISATGPPGLWVSEANCDLWPWNWTLIFKDQRAQGSGKEAALVAVVCFAGAVGLTCLVLAIFNWKLQQRKANEHTSEKICCRTLNESPCTHEARQNFTKGFCNCSFLQENEMKVRSSVGCGNGMPPLQESGSQATAELIPKSTGPGASIRNTPRRKDPGAGCYFLCLNCRSEHSYPLESSVGQEVVTGPGRLTRCFQERGPQLGLVHLGEKPWSRATQRLPQAPGDISNGTLNRRIATPTSALARGSLQKHLTNESWQPPIETEDNALQPHRQRRFITSSSSKPSLPSEHCVLKTLQNRRSKYEDPGRAVRGQQPTYVQANGSLISEYVPWEQLRDCRRGKKPKHRKHVKAERKLEENDPTRIHKRDGQMESVRGIKKRSTSERVSFHDPNWERVNRSDALLIDTTEAGLRRQQRQRPIQSQVVILDAQRHRHSWGRSQEGNLSLGMGILEKERTGLPKSKHEMKRPNLSKKFNVHPFRKARIHPEKSPHREKSLPKSSKQPSAPRKSPKGPRNETKRKPANTVPEAPFLGSTGSAEICKSMRTVSQNFLLKPDKELMSGRNKDSGKAVQITSIGENTLLIVKKNPLKSAHHTSDNISNGNHTKICTLIVPPDHSHPLHQTPHEEMENALGDSFQGSHRTLGPWDSLACHVSQSLPSRVASEHIVSESAEPSKFHSWLPTEELKEVHCYSRLKEEAQKTYESTIDTFSKEYNGNLDQGADCQLPRSSLELGQPGQEKRNQSQITEERIKEYRRGEETESLGRNQLQGESCEFPPSLPTLSKSNAAFMETHLIPSQNSLELSKDISTSLSDTQANWHLTSSSKKGIHDADELHRTDSTEAPVGKITGKEIKNLSGRSEVESPVVTQLTQMDSNDVKNEVPPTAENGKSEVQALSDTSLVKISSLPHSLGSSDSDAAPNGPPWGEKELQKKSDVHRDNGHALQEDQNLQPREGDSIGKEDDATLEMH